MFSNISYWIQVMPTASLAILGVSVKILVIDDDEDIAEIISPTFELRWPEAVTIASCYGATGIDMVEAENPDFVILDLGLNDMDGFAVCRGIRLFSYVPIVILTTRNEESDVVKGLDAGADDYIVKPFKVTELLARVQAVLRRCQLPSVANEHGPFQAGGMTIDFVAREVYLRGECIRLTPTESQILHHMAKNPGRVHTYRSLLGWVWGRDYLDETRYIKVHIQRLRAKLEVDAANPELILTERSEGYRIVLPV